MKAPTRLAPGWRSFDKADWDGFAGSERFDDGAEPLIAEVKLDGIDAVAIVDNEGACVLSFEDTGGDFSWRQVHEWERGAALASAWLVLQPAGTEFTTAELEALGFEAEDL